MITATVLGAVAGMRAIARRAKRFELRDRVALVTGGSRGLGLAIARSLVEQGAKVAICARDIAELEHAVGELGASGGVIEAIACDLTDPAQLELLVPEVQRRLGAIDVLINNAGVIQVGPMSEMTFADYRDAMTMHLWVPLQLANAVLPSMLERRAGRIANVASIGGKIAVPHMLPYSASKFALVGWSEGLRAELAKHDVWVTTVVPGLMRTGSPPFATYKGQRELEYAWFATGDNLRLTSMRVDRAARRIVRAIRDGEPEVVLSIQAKLAAKLHALAPVLAQRVLAGVDRMLPAPPPAAELEPVMVEIESIVVTATAPE